MEMPKTIIVKKPRRSGKWWTLGANCTESRLGNNKGMPISIPIPTTHKNNLNGRGTNTDTNHIPATIENPIEYLVVSSRASGTYLLVRTYSITRMTRVVTYDSTNQLDFSPNP